MTAREMTPEEMLFLLGSLAVAVILAWCAVAYVVDCVRLARRSSSLNFKRKDKRHAR